MPVPESHKPARRGRSAIGPRADARALPRRASTASRAGLAGAAGPSGPADGTAPGRVEIAVLDRCGVIVAVNPAWTRFARANGGDPARTGVGTSYLAVCDAADDPEASQVAQAIRLAVAGELTVPRTVRMPCDSPDEARTVDVVVSSRLADDGSSLGATVALIPVSAGPLDIAGTDERSGSPEPVSPGAAGGAGRDVVALLERAADALRATVGADGATLTVDGGLGAAEVEVGKGPLAAVIRQVSVPLGDDEPPARLCLRFSSADAAAALDAQPAALLALAGTAIGTACRVGRAEQRQRYIDWAVGLLERVLSEEAPRGPDVARALVAEDAAALFDADGCLLLISVDEASVQVRAATGLLGGELGRSMTRVPGAVEEALRSGRPALEDDGSPAGTVLWVPLGRDAPASCVLGLLRAGNRPFPPADVADAAAFGAAAGRVLNLDAARARRERTLLREDRDRIAADLHDHVVQQLFAVGQGLDLLAARSTDAAQRSRLGSYVSALDASVRRIRDSIHRLHSDDAASGLRQRIIAVLDEEIVALGFAVHADFEGPVDTAVDERLADDVVAVVREALSNTARHARATRTEVRIGHRDGTLTVEVVDDGIGARGPRPGGHGLGNLHHRARDHEGRMELTHPPEGGTRLIWTASTRRS